MFKKTGQGTAEEPKEHSQKTLTWEYFCLNCRQIEGENDNFKDHGHPYGGGVEEDLPVPENNNENGVCNEEFDEIDTGLTLFEWVNSSYTHSPRIVTFFFIIMQICMYSDYPFGRDACHAIGRSFLYSIYTIY